MEKIMGPCKWADVVDFFKGGAGWNNGALPKAQVPAMRELGIPGEERVTEVTRTGKKHFPGVYLKTYRIHFESGKNDVLVECNQGAKSEVLLRLPL